MVLSIILMPFGVCWFEKCLSSDRLGHILEGGEDGCCRVWSHLQYTEVLPTSLRNRYAGRRERPTRARRFLGATNCTCQKLGPVLLHFATSCKVSVSATAVSKIWKRNLSGLEMSVKPYVLCQRPKLRRVPQYHRMPTLRPLNLKGFQISMRRFPGISGRS